MLNYKEAIKEAMSEHVKENYMVISVSYNFKLVLKYKDGMALMNALSTAEQFNDEYQESKQKIIPLNRGTMAIALLSGEEYARYKVAQLLNISIADLDEHFKST